MAEGGGGGGRGVGSWGRVGGSLLVALRPTIMLAYLRDESAKTSVCAATLRQKLQIKRSVTHSHSLLTPGQPVSALNLSHDRGAWLGC